MTLQVQYAIYTYWAQRRSVVVRGYTCQAQRLYPRTTTLRVVVRGYTCQAQRLYPRTTSAAAISTNHYA